MRKGKLKKYNIHTQNAFTKRFFYLRIQSKEIFECKRTVCLLPLLFFNRVKFREMSLNKKTTLTVGKQFFCTKIFLCFG